MFWKKSKPNIALSLVTIEAYSADVGKKIGRIYKGDMKVLKASYGDFLEIHGKSRIIIKSKETYPSDEGRGIIRLDRSDRFKAQVEIGQTVVVQKIILPEAQKVVLKPLVKVESIDERNISSQFVDIPLMRDETVTVYHFEGPVAYLLIGTVPDADAVLCTTNTVFRIMV